MDNDTKREAAGKLGEALQYVRPTDQTVLSDGEKAGLQRLGITEGEVPEALLQLLRGKGLLASIGKQSSSEAK